jgi:hypothetical protein
MPIPTAEDSTYAEVCNASDLVELKLSVMRRAKDPVRHKDELRALLQDYANRVMAMANGLCNPQ